MKRLLVKLVDNWLLKVMDRHALLVKRSLDANKQALLAKFQSIGAGCRLNGDTWTITKPGKVVVGNNVHFGNHLYINSSGGVIVGDNTHMSRYVTIYSYNHRYEGSVLPYDHYADYKPVTIGKNVWIGMNVSILPGVTIGDGAIIGMGTVVSRDVEALAIIGSPPFRVIKSRDAGRYEELDSSGRYGGVSGMPLDKGLVEKYLESYRDRRKSAIIFVLGTGRSGSSAFVDTFNQHPDCVAYHENFLQLVRLGTLFAHHEIDKDGLYRELDKLFAAKLWDDPEGKLVIHSDQKFWNMIPILADYFENAKFIHLAREPLAASKSMAARGWFEEDEYKDHRHDWALFRISASKMGLMPDEDWASLKPLDKCLWYWSHVNRTIEQDLKALPSERTYYVRLDQLDDEIRNIQRFLGLVDKDINAMKTNVVKPQHRQNYEALDNQLVFDERMLDATRRYLSESRFDFKLAESS